MSRRLLIGAGAITIAVAVAGCLWVPLLMLKLKSANEDLTTAQEQASKREADYKIAKKSDNELKTSLRVDLSQAENERDRVRQELKDARTDLHAKTLELQAIKDGVDLSAVAKGSAKAVEKSDELDSGKAADANKGIVQSDDGGKRAAAAKPKVASKFADDSLYDDSGWKSLAVNAKVVTEKPATDAATVEQPTTLSEPPIPYEVPLDTVVPIYDDEIVIPLDSFYRSPIYIYP